MKSSKDYFIRITRSPRITVALPEGRLKRTVRRLLEESKSPPGTYHLRISVYLELNRAHHEPHKVAVSAGGYINTAAVEMHFVDGSYIGTLTYPDEAIANDRLEQLVGAALRLPTLAMRSDDETPRAKRKVALPTRVIKTAGRPIASTESEVATDIALLESRLHILTDRLHALQGQLMFPRSVLHPSSKEPIRREILDLQATILSLQEQSRK